MLIGFLGWLWIIMGVVFLLNPEFLRKRLQRKSLKKIRRLLFAAAVFLGVLLITAAFKSHGLLSKLLLVLGIIAVFKGMFFLKGKVADKVLGWYAAQPILIFRLGACVQILLGVIILFLRK